jgi:NADH oxidase (H2O2-forming)
MRIILAGLGAGGLFAGIAVKKRNPKAKLIIVDKKDYDLLSPCGLPFAIEGIVPSFEDVVHEYHLPDIEKYMKHEVIKLDPKNKKITALHEGTKFDLEYDKLILDLGSSPFIPPIPGAFELLNKGVFTVSDIYDCSNLKKWAKPQQKAIVVGAGAIGLETAVALRHNGMEVVVIEMLDSVLPKAIDSDMADILSVHLDELGIKVMKGSRLEKINGEDKVKSVVIDGHETDTHLVVMASGVKQNCEIARTAGLEVGRFGIVTNERMQTSDPDIYAIGDCVQVKNAMDGKDWTMQLAVAAYRQGLVAGTNAAGGNDEYMGALTTFASKIGEIEVAATGYNSHFAKERGYDIFSVKAKGLTRPDWFPGAQEIVLKVIFNKKDGKIIGAQCIAPQGAAGRINVMSTAISAGFDVHRMQNIELAYCPAVSETYDVINKAADIASKKFELIKKRSV